MSRKSKNESNETTHKPRDLKRDLPAELLEQAKEHADRYAVVLEPDDEVGFRGTSLEFPTVLVTGATPTKCLRHLREALMVAVAVMLEQGRIPPLPASESRRDAQVNIRLTLREKAMLEQAAKQHGFRGISDFMRNIAMSQLRRSA